MIMPAAKSVGKDIAKRGLKIGIGSVKDKLTGKNASMVDSLKKRTANALDQAASDYFNLEATQDGMGLRKRRRKQSAPKRRRKTRRKTINKLAKKKSKSRKQRDIFG